MNKVLMYLGAAAALLALVAIPYADFWGAMMPWIKALPVFFWSLWCLTGSGPGRAWGAAALALATLGDYVLAVTPWSLAGVGLFLAVQILYAVRFWTWSWGRRGAVARAWPWALACGGGLVVAVLVAWPVLGAKVVPAAVYGLLLGVMAVGAAASGIGRTVLWGAIAFLVSDVIIVIREAVVIPAPWWDWVVLAPYWVGQGLLAAGLRRGRPAHEVVTEATPAEPSRLSPEGQA